MSVQGAARDRGMLLTDQARTSLATSSVAEAFDVNGATNGLVSAGWKPEVQVGVR
jgi:hypothetical protein